MMVSCADLTSVSGQAVDCWFCPSYDEIRQREKKVLQLLAQVPNSTKRQAHVRAIAARMLRQFSTGCDGESCHDAHRARVKTLGEILGLLGTEEPTADYHPQDVSMARHLKAYPDQVGPGLLYTTREQTSS